MRVVLDTNVIVSGLFWRGPPRQLLDWARENTLALYTSAVLLDELASVLARAKFATLLATYDLTPSGLMQGYAMLSHLVAALCIGRVVPADVDDDAVIACALAASADLIVTGDRDLLALRTFRNIPILTPADVVQRIHAADPTAL